MPSCTHRPASGRNGHEQHRHISTLEPPRPVDPYLRVPGPHVRRRRPTAIHTTGLPKPCPHSPCQSRPERRRERQHTALLVGQQRSPDLVRVPGRRVHHRQPGRLRNRPHPARCGPAQDGTALRTEHRTRPATAPALGRQHQVGEVLPPPPHAHHCANARADRPPLWTTTCGKLRPPPDAYFGPATTPDSRTTGKNRTPAPQRKSGRPRRSPPPAGSGRNAHRPRASTARPGHDVTPDKPARSRPSPPSATASRTAAARSRPPSSRPAAAVHPRTR